MASKDQLKKATQEKRSEVAGWYEDVAARVESDPDYAEQFQEFAERFHTYSVRNQMLIFTQMPDATLCAGFNKWKAEGRVVRKGEKGICIMAPVSVKEKDKEGEVQKDKDGEEKKTLRFRVVRVFDVSQTDPLEEKNEGSEDSE